ncbi:MAG: GNAT family N-acetyltransferase [Oligosphaeraceae bacterium]
MYPHRPPLDDASQRLLDALALRLADALGHQLAGVYLHGSLALGAYRREHSDLDLLVVADAPVSLPVRRALLDAILAADDSPDAPAGGLECSLVLLDDCRRPTHPLPFALHYSRAHAQPAREDPDAFVRRMTGADHDLVAYLELIRQQGIVLLGRPIAEVFGPIAPADLHDSLVRNVPEPPLAGDDLLNACRLAAFRRTGQLLSKEEGAVWARQHAPEFPADDLRALLRQRQPGAIVQPTPDDLPDDLLDDFQRRQPVTHCWRKRDGQWLLLPIAFTDDWTPQQLRDNAADLRRTLRDSGIVLLALHARRVIGFAALAASLSGSRGQYLQLTDLHVSLPWRGLGLGARLFKSICREAARRGAARLYISSQSSQETQAFYRAMGCREATEYQPALVAAEPCDCQLERDLAPTAQSRLP